MYEFFFSWQTIPFMGAMLVVVMFGTVELIGRAFGVSVIHELDDLRHVEFDVDPEDPDAIPPLLKWISLDRVPLLLWFIVLCIGFGVPGYSMNIVSKLIDNTYVNIVVSVATSIVIAILTVRVTGTPISNRLRAALPSERMTHPNYLVGEPAIICYGTATHEKEAKARLTQTNRYGEYIMVKSCYPDRTFPPGSDVILMYGNQKEFFVSMPSSYFEEERVPQAAGTTVAARGPL
ncbi:OB-fold-containig protein [Alteromonas oceanisediminis]|uniref:OB-fold-containig protein n=1 Tax=Alteromonas oceanisediminis TaxID=2836180 RepID=UPI001BD97CC4|nr:OB-fold-containig protein [Alteromonas oceanisediminis]MBT0587403.1 DUF1449 family protein [Alteromonas oceanisediminis]